MISSKYAIQECVDMLIALGMNSIRVDQTIPEGYSKDAVYYFLPKSSKVFQKNNSTQIPPRIIPIDAWWHTRISLTVSWAYAEWIRKECKKNIEFIELESLLHKFHDVIPRSNSILIV